jgi:hypothetical protein
MLLGVQPAARLFTSGYCAVAGWVDVEAIRHGRILTEVLSDGAMLGFERETAKATREFAARRGRSRSRSNLLNQHRSAGSQKG